MSLWRQLTRGVRALTHRQAADQDVADEVQHYFDQAAAALVASGLSPDDARRAARLQLGNMTVIREQVRASGWENAIGALLADLRYAARRLRHAPGFTAASALILALGIGASTTIFSALDPILFEPLPYPHAGRLAMIWDVAPGGARLDATFGTYRELEARSRSFAAIAVMKPWQPTMTGPAEPERLDGQSVAASYFRVLGVPPLLGRDFAPSDDRRGAPKVAILSSSLWRRRFAGDRAIVGRRIILEGDPYTVVGVMPRGFENVLAPAAEVWTPLAYDMSLPQAWGHHLRMAGRLRPGIDMERAGRELGLIARTPAPQFPRAAWAAIEQGFIVTSLQEDVTRGVRPVLVAVAGAVLLILLIACVNVTNLVLARGAQRSGELALRSALGAGRGRLVRQLLTESLLLAALGGVLGMAVAEIGVRALVTLAPAGLPRVGAIGVSATAFAFGLGITTLLGLACGAIPALRAGRRDPHLVLQQASRRTADGQVTRGALVVAEVALALVLLASSGLLWRSLQRLFAVAPGFAPAHLLTMQVQTSGHRFDADGAAYRFFAAALDAVRRVPGVAAAALTSQLPLSGDDDKYGVRFASSVNDDPARDRGAFRYAVSPGYFETMGIPLRRGRLLDAHDRHGAPGAVVINEAFAHRVFPGADPVGQRLRVGPDDGPWDTVVGVVGDVKQTSLAAGQADAVYIPAAQWRFADDAMSLVVRARGSAPALAPAIWRAVWSVDKDQPIVRVATMDNLLARSAAERRFALMLFALFALAALALAGAGIYGVLSGSVAERTREIGVRSALGASRRDILALVLRRGMTLTAVGVVIGLPGAMAASGLITTLLFGVSRLDAVTHLGVVALLLGVAVFACWIPAARAARVDPALALRAE